MDGEVKKTIIILNNQLWKPRCMHNVQYSYLIVYR